MAIEKKASFSHQKISTTGSLTHPSPHVHTLSTPKKLVIASSDAIVFSSGCSTKLL